MVLNVHRNRTAYLGRGERGGEGYGGGGRGTLYTYRYTVTTRMIPALRWAVMRAILMFQKEVMDNVTRQCPQTTTFLKRKENRSGIELGPSAYQPNALPLGQTGSHSARNERTVLYSSCHCEALGALLEMRRSTSVHKINECLRRSELRSCVKVEVDVLGSCP